MLLNNLIIGSGTKSCSVGYVKYQFKPKVGSGLKKSKEKTNKQNRVF